jgi:hypothetical protein
MNPAGFEGLRVSWALALGCLLLPCLASAQLLPLPPRSDKALTGSEFIHRVNSLNLAERETEILSQVMLGNVPSFLRQLAPVAVTHIEGGTTNRGIFYATPDYLAIGSDDDYLLTPMSPGTAQRIADRLNCTLPTSKMVDAIYLAAKVKLAPSPIPPSEAMTSVRVFAAHNATVRAQRLENDYSPGALVAGHKKDLVLTPKLAAAGGKVAIYGWHQTTGQPIQPVYVGHSANWVDYSQCARLVQQTMVVNGESSTVAATLSNASLCGLLSDEGVIGSPRYSTNWVAPSGEDSGKARPVSTALTQVMRAPRLEQFESSRFFNERVIFFTNQAGVRVHINAPGPNEFDRNKKLLLIFYALPNGNTIEQTVGKSLKAGDDWHYDIQHIGAQTRFLRERLPENRLVVAYLENNLKSWPAWRRQNGDQAFPALVATVKDIFASDNVEVVLNGHSGGGSFIFGFINALQAVPDDVVRIAFLDSNYGYDRGAGHDQKLTKWLKASPRNALCVLAYNDAVALLDGKTFVSAAGGTWGRSHAMQHDLAEEFSFTTRTNAGLESWVALNGRIQFLLKENPDKKILHTIQVERNGFIHSLVSGTENENKGYDYLGARAYGKWIQRE